MKIKEMVTNQRGSSPINEFSLSKPQKYTESSGENMHTDVRV